jgi:hypothetical protein
MHAKDDVPVAVGASDQQTDSISRSGEPSLSPAAASSFPQQSRATRSATTASKPHDTSPLSFPDSGESVQVRSKGSVQKDVVYLSPQEHKRFKHGREVPRAAQLQYLKPQLIAQALAHHKIVSPKELRESMPIQVPVVRGKTPTTNHKDNVQDLFSYIFHSPVTLADIGISEQRKS